MAKRPDQDPQITDLSRYRKARDVERRRPAPRPPRPGFLGSNPRAGLILGIVALVLTALYLGPLVVQVLRAALRSLG